MIVYTLSISVLKYETSFLDNNKAPSKETYKGNGVKNKANREDKYGMNCFKCQQTIMF